MNLSDMLIASGAGLALCVFLYVLWLVTPP